MRGWSVEDQLRQKGKTQHGCRPHALRPQQGLERGRLLLVRGDENASQMLPVDVVWQQSVVSRGKECRTFGVALDLRAKPVWVLADEGRTARAIRLGFARHNVE